MNGRTRIIEGTGNAGVQYPLRPSTAPSTPYLGVRSYIRIINSDLTNSLRYGWTNNTVSGSAGLILGPGAFQEYFNTQFMPDGELKVVAVNAATYQIEVCDQAP